MRLTAILFTLLSLFCGCAHVFPEDLLKTVNRGISFKELREDPGRYTGETVLLAGVVVKVEYRDNLSLLEIYQTAMDREDRPVNVDVSGGRFMAQYHGFLDRAIYREGRKVTVVGRIEGVKVRKLGEIDYRYPLIVVRDIHLWKEEKPRVCDPYPWYPMGMRGPFGPWYYPYWP